MKKQNERMLAYLRIWYQCRAGWLLLAIAIPLLTSTLFMPLKNDRDPGALIGLLLLSAVLAGFHKASTLLDVLRMKLAFTIPNTRQGALSAVKAELLALALYGGLVTCRVPTLTGLKAVAVPGAVALSTASVYLVTVWFITSVPKAGQFLGFLGFLPVLAQLTRLPAIITHVYLLTPAGVMLASFAAAIMVWCRLLDRDRQRAVSGQRLLTFFDGLNRRKVQQYRATIFRERAQKQKSPRETATERGALALISELPAGSARRWTATTLYEILGAANGKSWLASAAVAVALVTVFCYMPGPHYTAPLFAMPAFMLAFVRRPATAPPGPLPWDRKGRFLGTLGATLALTMMTVAVLLVLTWLTHLLRPVMPELILAGNPYTFHPIHAAGMLCLLFGAPLAVTVAVLVERSTMAPALLGALLFPLIVLWAGPLQMLGLRWLAMGAALLWCLFPLVLAYHCFRRDLGRALG